MALCKAAGVRVDRVVDDNLDVDGTTLFDVPVAAPIREHLPVGGRAVIAIGDNAARARVLAAITRSSLARVPRARVRVATIRSRHHVLAHRVRHVRVPQQ